MLALCIASDVGGSACEAVDACVELAIVDVVGITVGDAIGIVCELARCDEWCLCDGVAGLIGTMAPV